MKKIILGVLGVLFLGIIFFVLQKQQGSTSSVTQSVTTTKTPQQDYTLSDISQHATATSCWMAINGKVYDVTSFIPQHPGGDDILKGCGKDATALFTGEDPNGQRHPPSAQNILNQYQIGTLK